MAVQTDATTIGKQIGFNSFDFGDQKSIYSAAVSAVNAQGGLFGRKIVLVLYDVSSTGDPSTEAQEACALWTQDHHVIAASLVARISIDNTYACMAKAHVPIITPNVGANPVIAKDIARFTPYLDFPDTSTMDRLVETWLSALSAMGYFQGWNTVTGAPGPAPVKVGILFQDYPTSQHAWEQVRTALQARHIEVADFISWNASNVQAFSSDVLKLKQDGVTHLFLDPLAGIFYPSQAQSQHYFARYAVTSNNFLQPFLVNGAAPKDQLKGMMGVAWSPYLDVNQQQAPTLSAQTKQDQQECLRAMRAKGIDASKRNYQYVAFTVCALFRYLKQSAEAGGGLTPTDLARGEARVNATFDFDTTLAPGAAPAPDQLQTVQPILWDTACQCTKYVRQRLQLPQ